MVYLITDEADNRFCLSTLYVTDKHFRFCVYICVIIAVQSATQHTEKDMDQNLCYDKK